MEQLAADDFLDQRSHAVLPGARALEDALEIQRVLSQAEGADVPAAFKRYAQRRWERCARVQRRSLRNGTIFHASGALRFSREGTTLTVRFENGAVVAADVQRNGSPTPVAA